MPLESRTSPLRLGDYELLYELKSGGMGKIFLGRKRGTGGFEKLVAIKTILRELADRSELRSMFLDEARLLSRLDHPAVAQVHDFGEHDQTLYLAMEYVAGVRFAELIQHDVPPAMSVRLIAEVCRALHAAHELRDLEGRPLEVVHRDVSPDNLMLSFDGHVKVLDFGIALMRGRQAPVTEYGTVKGKPPYLSPEQVRGERIDRRTDIWSVGVVLWEMLTGEHLFDGDSLYAVARAVEEQEIPAPSTVAGQLPEGLDRIVQRALSRDVSSRYQRAQDMADDLLQVANSIAAPSTTDYAAAALGELRESHREWLRKVLGGQSAHESAGRPSGMVTVPAMELNDGAAADPAPAEAGLERARDAAADGSVSDALAAERALEALPAARAGDASTRDTRSKKRSWLIALLVVCVPAAMAGAAAWYRMGSGDRDAVDTTASADPLAVLVAADAAPVVELQVDAGAPAITAVPPVDAAPTPADARVRDRAATHKKHQGDRHTPTTTAEVETATTPAAATGFGTLTVAAEPYALVRIDGKEVGATPLFNRKIAAGSHVVELIHPDTGSVRLRKKVDVAASGHQSVIDR